MGIWRVQGGYPLDGSVTVQGAKNAVLPVLAACVLTGAEIELTNVPDLLDVAASLDILRHLGCRAERRDDVVSVDARAVTDCAIGRALTGRMRSSVIFLGAILARCGRARIAMPGGCALGPRPVDLHLAALAALGAEVSAGEEEILCAAPHGLTGAVVALPFPSVGATENTMIAACAARGTTLIRGAAREPEIVHLQGFLRALGADMDGAGTSEITIRGMRPAGRTGWRIMPDRIAGATLLCACASAGGEVELRGLDPAQLESVTDALSALGAQVRAGTQRLAVRCAGRLRGGVRVVTAPYPGFPTDAQPLLMAAALKAEGESVFTETIFPDRFRHGLQMARMGAQIRLGRGVCTVTGVERLHGADVQASDLRGGAALIAAALGAEGETRIADPGYVARGYEALDRTLYSLGAHIKFEE